MMNASTWDKAELNKAVVLLPLAFISAVPHLPDTHDCLVMACFGFMIFCQVFYCPSLIVDRIRTVLHDNRTKEGLLCAATG